MLEFLSPLGFMVGSDLNIWIISLLVPVLILNSILYFLKELFL